MKLFGKKTLALFLALAMVMPMCAFATETTPTPVAVTSVELNKATTSMKVGETEKMTAEVKPSGATNKDVTWKTSDSSVVAITPNGAECELKGLKAGKATITVTTADGGKTDTCEVTVSMNSDAVITKVEAQDSITLPINISEKDALNWLKEKVKVTVTYDQGVVETTYEWEEVEGEDFDSKEIGNTCKYVPEVKKAPEGVELPVLTVTIGKAGFAKADSNKVDTLAVLLGVEEEDLDLPEYVSVELNNGESETFGIGDYDGKKAVNGLFKDWKSADYNDDKEGTYTFTAEWKGDSDEYELGDLKLTMKVVDSDFFKDEIDYKGFSLKEIAKSIDELLKGMYGEGLDHIVFDDIEMDGGMLYLKDEDGNLTETDEESFDADEFECLYYLPDGSGEDAVIEYTAYTEDDDEDVEGKIKLESDTFMLVSIEVTDKEYAELSAEAFEEAFLNMDKHYDSLDYVKFSGSNSKTRGYLYYDFDEEDEKGDEVKSSTKCYFDNDDADAQLDDIVYVPGSSMKGGTYIINFNAWGKDDKDKTVSNKPGYLRITLIEEADLTVETGKEQETGLDYDMFEEYFEDEVTKTYKNYVITAVSFDGAPHSASKGYLAVEGKKLKSPDDVKFWFNATDDDDDYLFEDLVYLGGTAGGSTRATFTIYGKAKATDKDSKIKALVSGEIDFVTGVSHTIDNAKNPMAAAKVLPFSNELDEFKKLGDNNNVYIEFTSLPKGGKLYYNYGTASQEDVTVGTDYYVSTSAGKKQLRYVTFVPSYSASKIDNVISFGIKGYNKSDKAVTGTVNIYVDYAVASAYFTDVKTSNYADSVDFLYNRGITTGMTTTTFGPNTNVTRGQFVTFLYRAAGQPAVVSANTFTDVKASDYYYNAVRWAVQNGITNGRSATIFDPNANVTYQEIMTFLYRYDVTYLKHTGVTGSSSVVYDYAKVDTWAQTAVKWAVGKGVLTAGNLNPTTAGTRANVALYMHRMLTL